MKITPVVTTSHDVGQCYSKTVLPDDLIYVNIPKNGSSLTRVKLSDAGYIKYNYHTLQKYNSPAFVVLRDPVERWLSGICEYLNRCRHYLGIFKEFDKNNNALFDLIFYKIEFDVHTIPQIQFINGLDTDNITFVWLDDKYKYNFSKFFSITQGVANNWDASGRPNSTNQSPFKSNILDILKEKLDNNPTYLKNIKNYYAQDYSLIQSVNFYNHDTR